MISVIFPTYNEQDNLEELHKRLAAVTKGLPYQFEFVFVDDCSGDKTQEIIKTLNQKDKRVKTIRFARNCGSHAAISAGLNFCRADECAIVMAADLQDPPELIELLIKEWKTGAKIVWGVRAARVGEKTSTNFLSQCYYRLMNWLTNVKLPPTGADVFLTDKAVIEAFKGVVEKHTSVFMTLAWLGFKQTSIDYIKQARRAGQSKWTLGKKIKLTLDSLLAFSDIPIRYMSILGFLTAFLGFLYALYVLWSFITGSPVEGWSSLMVAILVVGGVQMMMLGVLGEYLWRTFDESRKRPRYIVEYKIE